MENSKMLGEKGGERQVRSGSKSVFFADFGEK